MGEGDNVSKLHRLGLVSQVPIPPMGGNGVVDSKRYRKSKGFSAG